MSAAQLATTPVDAQTWAGGGVRRRYLREASGRIVLLQSSPTARYAPQTLQQLDPAAIQAFVAWLDAQGFHNFGGLAYRPSPTAGARQWVEWPSERRQMQYLAFTAPTLPLGVYEIITAWEHREQLIAVETDDSASGATLDPRSTGFPRLE